MKNLDFPLSLQFKISTFTNDFTVKDTYGTTVAYVKQKLFKFIEEITVFTDESQTTEAYRIKANKWIDFSAAYTFFDNQGKDIGKVARKGWASLWKANYEVYNTAQQQEFVIREENAWIKVLDAIFVQIPIIGLFTGYFFNPAYKVSDLKGTVVARLEKEPSFWGRKFSVTKLTDISTEEQERIVLALTMMILLERRRG